MVNAAAITVATQLFNHQAGQLKEEFIISKSILKNQFCITHPYCSRVSLYSWGVVEASSCPVAKEMKYIPYEPTLYEQKTSYVKDKF